jgi:hypothetical protein
MMEFLFESSPLSFMGYIVGAKGASTQRRRDILRIAIQHHWSSDVKGKFSEGQLVEWGNPGADRYRKIVATSAVTQNRPFMVTSKPAIK